METFTTKQVAKLFGCNESRIRQIILFGMLPAVKHGRDWVIDEEGIETYKSKYVIPGFRKEYHLWASMRSRCNNPDGRAWHHYGGRGIKVCPRWDNSFWNFIEDMGEKPLGKSLERINNDGDYSPENCRWETAKQQQNNRRCTVFVEFHGNTISTSQLADKLGIKSTMAYYHLVKRKKTVPELIAFINKKHSKGETPCKPKR